MSTEAAAVLPADRGAAASAARCCAAVGVHARSSDTVCGPDSLICAGVVLVICAGVALALVRLGIVADRVSVAMASKRNFTVIPPSKRFFHLERPEGRVGTGSCRRVRSEGNPMPYESAYGPRMAEGRPRAAAHADGPGTEAHDG